MQYKKGLVLVIGLFSMQNFAQSDLDRVLKGGELLLGGLSILKVANSEPNDSKGIKSLCVKNKLLEKITFKLVGLSAEIEEVKKELIIPKDGKECLLQVPKGIYMYEIVLPNKETYKKGEYNFEGETTITIKQE